jgi:hypothetical protein
MIERRAAAPVAYAPAPYPQEKTGYVAAPAHHHVAAPDARYAPHPQTVAVQDPYASAPLLGPGSAPRMGPAPARGVVRPAPGPAPAPVHMAPAPAAQPFEVPTMVCVCFSQQCLAASAHLLPCLVLVRRMMSAPVGM